MPRFARAAIADHRPDGTVPPTPRRPARRHVPAVAYDPDATPEALPAWRNAMTELTWLYCLATVVAATIGATLAGRSYAPT
jgi:hypothetical protein